MGDLQTLSELRAKSEESRMDFLRTDLALCFTFTDLAKTEIAAGDRDAAIRVYAKAEDGYTTIAHFVPEVRSAEHRNEITRRLRELRAVLDVLQQRLHA